MVGEQLDWLPEIEQSLREFREAGERILVEITSRQITEESATKLRLLVDELDVISRVCAAFASGYFGEALAYLEGRLAMGKRLKDEGQDVSDEHLAMLETFVDVLRRNTRGNGDT